MGLINRMRRRIDSIAGRFPMLTGERDELQFNAEMPGGDHGSIFKLNLSVRTDPHGDGERVHLRAHIQSNFASVLRPMLEAPPSRHAALEAALEAGESGLRSLAPRAAIGRLAARSARRVMSNRLVRQVADPLLHVDTNSYVEVVTSSASLDGGAFDLMPKSEKLTQLGVRPTRQQGPHVETWSGMLADGKAHIAAVQIDKDSLPESLRKQLGDTPFNLAAMIVSTIQEK